MRRVVLLVCLAACERAGRPARPDAAPSSRAPDAAIQVIVVAPNTGDVALTRDRAWRIALGEGIEADQGVAAGLLEGLCRQGDDLACRGVEVLYTGEGYPPLAPARLREACARGLDTACPWADRASDAGVR